MVERRFDHNRQPIRSDEVSEQAIPFTILEYIEFTRHAEFMKFRSMPIITRQDIDAMSIEDWHDLYRALLEEEKNEWKTHRARTRLG